MDGPFAELHHGPLPLLLPNAWDVPTALAFAAAGHPAVGTTSLGVSSVLGVPDGRQGTREANLALAHDLVRLPVPLSIDSESGYSDDPGEVAAYVAELAGLGVAGVNLEDSADGSLVAAKAFAAKVDAVKRATPGVFLNARVDTFWMRQEATVPATLARAAAYVDAGADGIFVPGLADPASIREITSALPVPVNVLPVEGLSLTDLAELGVRRVSTGSLPYRAALTAAVAAADAVRAGGPLPAAIPYPDLQASLAAYADKPR